MAEKSRRKGLTRRVNEVGKGYFDIWYKGNHFRIYTGRPYTPEQVSWFEAREILLAEMIENDTFEVEKARAVIGVTPQRQQRIVRKVDLTIQEFGDEWLERKKTAIGEAKVEEYRDTLALVCALEVGPQAQKKKQKPVKFGAIQLRELRAQHVDWLTNTLSRREGIKGPTMSNTRLNDILLKVVRPLLDLAYERDYLEKIPTAGFRKGARNTLTTLTHSPLTRCLPFSQRWPIQNGCVSTPWRSARDCVPQSSTPCNGNMSIFRENSCSFARDA